MPEITGKDNASATIQFGLSVLVAEKPSESAEINPIFDAIHCVVQVTLLKRLAMFLKLRADSKKCGICCCQTTVKRTFHIGGIDRPRAMRPHQLEPHRASRANCGFFLCV